MTPKKVALRLGQFFARIDPASAGHGPFGWFPVLFDQRDASSPDAVFELSKPDSKLQLRHLTTNADLGADATEFSGDLIAQFYGKPGGARGGYESWNGWTLGQDGIDIVVVEYDREGAKYASACLTVMELP
jgi:hypothetical protein